MRYSVSVNLEKYRFSRFCLVSYELHHSFVILSLLVSVINGIAASDFVRGSKISYCDTTVSVGPLSVQGVGAHSTHNVENYGFLMMKIVIYYMSTQVHKKISQTKHHGGLFP